MTILLETKNLSIEYKSINEARFKKEESTVKALKNVSLKIHKGEIYALAGESGCGKSTLAKAIVKLVKPVDGNIFFNGNSILEQTKDQQKNIVKMYKWYFRILIRV